MKTNHDIKRGISSYTLQEAYYFKKLDLEDCIAAAADMGAVGIEIIPDQMFREFPNISDDFVDKWHGMMERYGTTPTCIDDFVETRLYKGRNTSMEEKVNRFIKFAKLAEKLRFFIIREQFALGNELMTPELLEKCLPYAEKHNVIIGMEVHTPNYLGNPEIDPFMKIIEKSPHAALIVDFGIFMHSMPEIIKNYYIRQGARKEVVEYGSEAFRNNLSSKEILKDSKKFKPTPVEEDYITQVTRFKVRQNPEVMKEYAPYIKHFHGKSFEINENFIDESIDVHKIVKVIKEMGYKGYISSEVEGNRYVHDAFEYDCIEQVIRHQKLLENALGN